MEIALLLSFLSVTRPGPNSVRGANQYVVRGYVSATQIAGA